jgi:hypothetical protein
VEEIRKIWLSDRLKDDVVAWFYEKSGVFSVRSAYRIAVQHEQESTDQPGSSARPDGTRSLFKGIWSAQVPNKVQIFAWRLSQEGLATQSNRRHRKLTQHATCQVCGVGGETGFHAVVQCPRASALRMKLREIWP